MVTYDYIVDGMLNNDNEGESYDDNDLLSYSDIVLPSY